MPAELATPAPAAGPPRITYPPPVQRPNPFGAILGGDAPWVLLIAALIVWTTITAKAGQSVSATTPSLLVAVVLSGIVGVLAALLGRPTARIWGAGTLLAAAAVVVYTGLSITWSVSPSQSWFETNRTLSYVAVMAGGVAAARLAPGRWQAPLGGVLLGTTVIVLLALASKVFPGALDPDQTFARLQEPLGYWNGIGTIAAICLVLTLWLGTRRNGYRPLNALAYPIAALAMVVLLLSYSRGSLAAAGIGTIVWLVFAPRRLHSLLVLGVGGVGGAFVGVWAFANTALSTDNVLLAARESSGTQLGVLLLATILLLLAIGLAIEFATLFTGVQAQDRRQLGLVIACLVALVPLAGIGVLATSPQGLTGSVSNAYTKLTDPTELAPSGDPSRFRAVGSQRSLYWRQAFRLYDAQPLHGVGAGGFGPVQSRARGAHDAFTEHAHGWVPQTLADLGALGLALQLLLGLTWAAAAGRGLGLYGPLRVGSRRPERDGTAAAVAVVGVFAVASIADWVWFIPGVTLPVMLLAGWVVGRGAQAAFPGGATNGHPRIAVLTPRTGFAVAIVLVTAAAAFSVSQPWRAERTRDSALVALDDGNLPKAERLARNARDMDPLSTEATYTLAQVLVNKGDIRGARNLFEAAVEQEPAVPISWQRLAEFELRSADEPKRAQRAAGIALKMAPTYRPARLTAVAANRQIVIDQQAAAPKEQTAP